MNSLSAQPQPIKTFLLTTTVLLVTTMAVISITYIATPRYQFTINQTILGWLGWATLTTSTLYISLKYRKECLFIFSAFFIFGFFTKAYLEPVSDQLDHLRRTYEKCNSVDRGNRINSGLWQYNMNSLFLCEKEKISTPEKKLLYIDVLHALYLSFASTILYSASRNAGLPPKWSIFSVITAFLFMGTNKFSYFRYYSYGPSFISLCIYWSWISIFFFSNKKKKIVYGFLSFIPIALIISVNHVQELTFLTFALFFWLIINFTEKICRPTKTNNFYILGVVIIFSIFFILPQFQLIREIFHSLIKIFYPNSTLNLWEKNQNIIYYWNNIHVMGKIWVPQYRLTETIGIIGLAPLAIAPLLFLCNQGEFSKSLQVRVTLLGALPFLILCTPLCHYIWVAHVQVPVYYRIAYSSLFWISIAYFLYITEIWVKKILRRRPAQNA